ncbi:hypothetical protein IMCC21224_11602 [Puniceibacterium sp. IMCC21224]|nr:hypothetical protein IMCC21224_11602 [Puniceibacterium sp. IMCC21224]
MPIYRPELIAIARIRTIPYSAPPKLRGAASQRNHAARIRVGVAPAAFSQL